MKSGMHIGPEVISEMKEKTMSLAIPRGMSFRTALIHAGEIDASVVRQGYFDYLISFGDLLNEKE
jgi:hypothetical protein